MIILSNSLAEIVDEGCLKVANSLVKRLKHIDSDIFIVSYERCSKISDTHLEINKFLLNKELARIIRKRKEKVVYFPFPAKPIATALRTFILSLYARYGLEIVLPLQSRLDYISRMLMKMSRAKIVVFSKESYDYFCDTIGPKRVAYLKTGVDTQKFSPVSEDEKKRLKIKYGLDPNRPVILHVGHLKTERNIGEMMKFNMEHQVLVVVSTVTKSEQDDALRSQLKACPNIHLIDEYIPNIQEIYQLADVYFFPVMMSGQCIDVPLSCMEAAACNKPVVTTAYGEMKEFKNKEGFIYIDSFDRTLLNEQIKKALHLEDIKTRQAVMDYDWDNSMAYFSKR
jgi:glycosyltransferase involved in cell wall biosynthesis